MSKPTMALAELAEKEPDVVRDDLVRRPAPDADRGRRTLCRSLWRTQWQADQRPQRLSSGCERGGAGSVEIKIPKLRQGSYFPGS